MSQKFKAGQIVAAKGYEGSGCSKYRVIGYKSVGTKTLVLEGVLTGALFDVVEGNFVEFTPKFEVGKTYRPISDKDPGTGTDGSLYVAAIVGSIVYTITPPPNPSGTGSMGISYKVWTTVQSWANDYTEVTD